MKKIVMLIVLLSLLGCSKQSTISSQVSGMTVLTSLEATKLLAQSLTERTGIRVELVVPATYSMNSHARYFKKHATEFNEYVKDATACVTIRSVWDHDDLYPFSRRSNVWIVEIDGSAPVDKTQAGVKLVKNPVTGKISPYIWRSPANLTKMADFVAKDLKSLYPDQASVIDSNLKSLKKDLFKLRTNYESKLIELESIEVISLTSSFDYLTSEFGIDVLESFLKQQIDWDQNDYSMLSKNIIKNEVKIVLCTQMPQQQLYETIVASGATPVVFTTLINAKDTHLAPKIRLFGFYSTNLDAIYNGLKM